MSMNTMAPFEWADASSVEQAISLLDKQSAIKAGGVDLVDLMKERIATPKRVVNIRNIHGLDYVKQEQGGGGGLAGGGLRIGPLVTLAKIADDPTIRKEFTALADAAGHAATPQVRNMATIGGNLLQRPRCWYFRNEAFHCRKKGGEKCYAQEGENQYHAIFNNGLCAIVHPSALGCALIALGGSVQLTGAKDKRELPLEKFFALPSVDLHRESVIEPDELITEIRVPALAANARSAYIKQGEKESFDWPVAEVAVVIEREGGAPDARCSRASVVLGAASPVPHRAVEAEAALKGKAIDAETARAAARAAVEKASPMSNNAYKIPVFHAVIERAILMAAGKMESAKA
jgi:xanthine dehydrogenase YagS FAD-binding subunit